MNSLKKQSWDYNYKAASQSLYGTDILLRNPDLGYLI